MKKTLFLLFISATFCFIACDDKEVVVVPPDNVEILYTMPEESLQHEGTWLQWPHEHQHGVDYRDALDATWVSMAKALVTSEKVHLVAYDDVEKDRITGLLNAGGVDLSNIDFKIYQTDDVWVRDNGPIYVHDKNNALVIEDWGFNGWGEKFNFEKCNTVPAKVAADQGKAVVDLNSTLTNEGGSIEIDGQGTLMACRSSILNSNRNSSKSQSEVEAIFKKYLGVSNFVWLEGKAGLDITDMHIDGFARFGNSSTIVTMSDDDLAEWQVPDDDIVALAAAKNKSGTAYSFVKLPLSQNNVVTTAGKDLGYKGSYVNYYIANNKVLVPNYSDPNDGVANGIIQGLYPGRTVVGIDVRNLYEYGGMVHCVTQQQPAQ